MKKRILLTFILTLTWSLGLPQELESRLMDGFKNELARAKHDTTKVNIMHSIINYSQFSNPDTAIFYFEKAHALAEKINYTRGKIKVLGSVSFAYIGLGNLPKALELAYKALEICEQYDLMSEATQSLNAIVAVYFDLEDYEKAMELQQKVHASLINKSSPIEWAYDKFWFGKVYEELGQLDSALHYLKEAEMMFQKLSYGADPGVYLYLGITEMKSGNPEAAINNYSKGLALAAGKNDHLNGSRIYSNLSAIYSQKNEKDSAIYFAKKAFSEAELMNQKKPLYEAATRLSELIEPTNAYEALRYYKIATTAKEELFGSGNIKAIQEMVTREEQRHIEIEAIELANRNRTRLNLLIGSLIMLSLITFLIFRNSRQKQKAKEKIEKAYTQLKSTQAQLIQSEKMASLGELTAGIAHEIQNPLNFVNNFSEVSKELVDEMNEELEKGDIEEAKFIGKDLKENLSKINHHGKRADAIVKGMLEHSRTGSGEKELTDINSLAGEYLNLAYQSFKSKNEGVDIKLTTDLDPTIPKIELVRADIGKVLLNILNNAFYACTHPEFFPDSYRDHNSELKPLVKVSTKNIGNKIEISVSDNGPGIPDAIKDKIFQPFFTTKPTGQGTGLGLSLSYDILKAHGGEIEVFSNVNTGTTFSFHLPIS